jgi:hypothetical protein
VVGRTGSGKSTLLLALYRMFELEKGSIYVDSVEITTLPLRKLRPSLSIIPQEPVVFSGSVRDNLDPWREYGDNDLWDVIKQVGGGPAAAAAAAAGGVLGAWWLGCCLLVWGGGGTAQRGLLCVWAAAGTAVAPTPSISQTPRSAWAGLRSTHVVTATHLRGVCDSEGVGATAVSTAALSAHAHASTNTHAAHQPPC